ILRSCNRDFAVVSHQDHEHRYRRAARLRCCRASVSAPNAFGVHIQTPYSSWRTRDFLRDSAATLSHLVLARVSNRREVLSLSLLRRRGDSNREFLVLLADSATNPDIQPHADSLTDGADRLARCAPNEILAMFSLVAGCDGSFRHRPRLRQSPSVVSTPTRTDRRRVCRRRLRLCWLENFFACHRGDFVDSARELVHNPCVLVRATVLPIICSATSQCRFGVEKSNPARRVDRGRGYGRSDHLLLWRAQGLAFSRDRRDLQ